MIPLPNMLWGQWQDRTDQMLEHSCNPCLKNLSPYTIPISTHYTSTTYNKESSELNKKTQQKGRQSWLTNCSEKSRNQTETVKSERRSLTATQGHLKSLCEKCWKPTCSEAPGKERPKAPKSRDGFDECGGPTHSPSTHTVSHSTNLSIPKAKLPKGDHLLLYLRC